MKQRRNYIFFGLMAWLLTCSSGLSFYGAAERRPANYIPNDEVNIAPYENSSWLNKIFVNDSAGVLENVSNDLERWEEQERFEELWGVRMQGQRNNTPNLDQKKSYLSRQLLKYVDKRLGGEVKKAEKGSTLHKVGKVQKALRPDTSVSFSNKFKLKFKARVLQGQASVYLINPYFKNSLDVNFKGHAVLRVSKKFKPLKLSTDVRVDMQNKTYATRLSRPVVKNVRAEVSSNRKLKGAPFESDANNKIQLRYFRAF